MYIVQHEYMHYTVCVLSWSMTHRKVAMQFIAMEESSGHPTMKEHSGLCPCE